ncbi:hypothetical protein B296_00012541 [Ensete ventricosum]|uniref:PIN domain-containing protein n=1 Tax=Ensete ventricosum TaxID=4639 RepID=A0A426Z7Q7_ENSVE|nr:hypothetical protein B296_00012541 [Ensete ventricosum]
MVPGLLSIRRHKSRTLASPKAATQNPNVAEGSLRLAPTIASPPLVSSPPQATRRAASSPLRIAGHPPRCASLRLVPPSAPLPRAAALRSTTHLCTVINLSEALNSFSYKEEVLNPKKKDLEKEKLPRNVVSSALFFKYNTALGPPYKVIVDTNFINFSIQNKVISLVPLL